MQSAVVKERIMKMNVFELNEAIRKIQEMDIDPEALADTLASLELPRNEKLDNVATWIENNEMKIEWLKKKLQLLAKTKKVLERQNNSLMQFLTTAIDNAGVKELQTANHLLKPRNYRGSVIVDSIEDLPIEYVIVPVPEPRADRKKLYDSLKNGETINGAHLKANRKTTIK